MTIQEIRNQVDKVLGNSLKCLLPSYWFKRLFGITLDKVEEVNRTSVTALTRVNKLSPVAFSGSYNDLTNKPTIPTIPSTLPNPNSLVIKKNGVQKVSYTGSYSATADITGDWYGTSSTSASTTAKSVSCSNYTLTSGERIAVKFTNANTASNPTLNVNNKGAKPIYWNGSALPSSQHWSAGAVIEFLYDGSYYHMLGAVKDKDTTIAVDTVMTASSTNPVQNKVVKEYIDNAVVTPVKSVTYTIQNIEPNKYYKWTSAMSSLTITFATPANESILNNYMFEFTTSSSGCAFSVPSTVKWANGEIPNIEASKTYQVSIINNLAVISNFM